MSQSTTHNTTYIHDVSKVRGMCFKTTEKAFLLASDVLELWYS
jgi:hypothetical protein